MERAAGTEIYGCGPSDSTEITLNVQTTTGGNFSVNVNGKSTVEYLKKVVSKKLKVSKDRICLLHREKQLREGTLEENGIQDGSRIILLPSVETGLLSQRPENSVMQALESLNDSQVNDFLSGKSPLNLTMRLGDHMMLIQLQLSTLSPGASKVARMPVKKSQSASSSPLNDPKQSNNTASRKASVKSKDEKLRSFLRKQDIVTLQNAFELFKSLAEIQESGDSKSPDTEPESSYSSPETSLISESSSAYTTMTDTSFTEQSPIKSLSNLVEENIANEKVTPVKFEPTPGTSKMSDSTPIIMQECLESTLDDTSNTEAENKQETKEQSSTFMMETPMDEYPMENLFNNALDKGLFSNIDNTPEISSTSTKNKRLHYLLHKTSKYKHPIEQNKQKAFMQSVINKHAKKKPVQTWRTLLRKLPTKSSETAITSAKQVSSEDENMGVPVTDSKALFEASKNLTQTLKKLSKEVLTNKVEVSGSSEESLRPKIGPGAVIESMKHHGKGIYSGTFSGTLNPALQDRYGRPKKDISTIIHILNDLLCATPSIPPTKETSVHPTNECNCASSEIQLCSSLEKKTNTTVTDICSNCEREPSQCKYARLQLAQGDSSDAPKCSKCSTSINMMEEMELCKKCHMADKLAIDNSKTKCKLEQLRLVMQQKKERREARKLKTLPYPPNAPLGHTSQDNNSIPEEIDTLA